MTSTYTSNLRIDKQGIGDNDSTWGTILNTDFDLLDFSIAGVTAVSTTGGTTTLTSVSGASDQSRAAVLSVTGTLVSNATIVAPATATKLYHVINGTSGNYTVTVSQSGGTGVVVKQGDSVFVFCNGTNAVYANTPKVLYSGVAGGTADALTSSTGWGLTSLVTGQIVVVRTGSANTGAATIAVDSVSAKTIQKNGSALIAGDLPASTTVSMMYDGTYFQLISGGSSGSSGTVSRTRLVLFH